jgi:hypothetical protein
MNWELNSLEDYKKMFDDIFKDNYQIIVVANKHDLMTNYYNIKDTFDDYFKSIFGENTILVQIPSVLNWSDIKESLLFKKGTLLLHINSKNDTSRINTIDWLYTLEKQ